MPLIVLATIQDLKLALREHEGEFKVGTSNANLWEDSGTAGVGTKATLTDSSKSWTPNFVIGAWLQDAVAKNFRVVSNTSTALGLSLCLDDGTTETPANGAYLVSKLGYYLGGAISRILSALGAVYKRPLLGTDNQTVDVLRDVAVNIAQYQVFAHSYRNSTPQGGSNIPEIIRDQYKDALAVLDEILSLRYPLKGEIRTQGAGIAMPRYTISDRLFGGIADLDKEMDSAENAETETNLGGFAST